MFRRLRKYLALKFHSCYHRFVEDIWSLSEQWLDIELDKKGNTDTVHCFVTHGCCAVCDKRYVYIVSPVGAALFDETNTPDDKLIFPRSALIRNYV